jgi:hypothetical protein
VTGQGTVSIVKGKIESMLSRINAFAVFQQSQVFAITIQQENASIFRRIYENLI